MIMSKAGAEVILKSLIGAEIDIDALPEGEEERVPAGVETVVFAEEIRGRDGRRIVEKDWVKKEKDDDECIVIKDEPED
jgi:DEAD/DEAH box helicase domain-containing protein